MDFILFLAFLVALALVPVMIGARFVGARNAGVGSALLAVIVQAAFVVAAQKLIANEVLSFIALVAASAIVFANILGTTFLRGLAVSIITAVLQTIAVIVFVGGFIINLLKT